MFLFHSLQLLLLQRYTLPRATKLQIKHPHYHNLARRSTGWTFSTLFPRILCAKVHRLDLQYNFPRDSLREGPQAGPSVQFPPGFFARRSTGWTFSTISPRILCAKVHRLDPQYTFPQDSLREGPLAGPSVQFPPGFFARRSTGWTFSTFFPRILCAKVHRLDLQYNFPQDSLREGPQAGPSVHFSPGFFARRSTGWTLSTISPRILCAKVHALDLHASGDR